jgi:hypothetical protein
MASKKCFYWLIGSLFIQENYFSQFCNQNIVYASSIANKVNVAATKSKLFFEEKIRAYRYIKGWLENLFTFFFIETAFLI